MRKIFLTLTVLVLITTVLFSSCASIVSKTSYPIYIRTNPAGANISITNKKGKEVYRGQSPTTVTLKSGAGYFAKAEYLVKLSSVGFEEKVIPINYKLNAWYFGNLFIGGLIGMLIIDPLTGAMWKIKDPVVNETLAKTSTTILITPNLNIVDIKNVSEESKSQLVRIN